MMGQRKGAEPRQNGGTKHVGQMSQSAELLERELLGGCDNVLGERDTFMR